MLTALILSLSSFYRFHFRILPNKSLEIGPTSTKNPRTTALRYPRLVEGSTSKLWANSMHRERSSNSSRKSLKWWLPEPETGPGSIHYVPHLEQSRLGYRLLLRHLYILSRQIVIDPIRITSILHRNANLPLLLLRPTIHTTIEGPCIIRALHTTVMVMSHHHLHFRVLRHQCLVTWQRTIDHIITLRFLHQCLPTPIIIRITRTLTTIRVVTRGTLLMLLMHTPQEDIMGTTTITRQENITILLLRHMHRDQNHNLVRGITTVLLLLVIIQWKIVSRSRRKRNNNNHKPIIPSPPKTTNRNYSNFPSERNHPPITMTWQKFNPWWVSIPSSRIKCDSLYRSRRVVRNRRRDWIILISPVIKEHTLADCKMKRKVYWDCYGTIWSLLIRVMEFRFSCLGIEVSTEYIMWRVNTYFESIWREYRGGLVCF